MNTESLAAISIGSILATEAVLQSLDAFTGGILGISGIARPEILATLPRLALGGAVIVMGILLFEAVLLQTPFGRALRAYREAPDTLDGMGVSSIRLVQTAIVTGSVITSVSASFFTWRVQFIDPSIAGIPTLIELLTISIIAFQPRVRAVAVATVFVTFLPETLRFLHLPATSFGQLRILVYSVLLIVLLHAFAPYFHFSKRSV
jgi:ABC-type branched-subunit amino acid transport system permease subunit